MTSKRQSVVPFRKRHKHEVEQRRARRSVLQAYKSYNFVDKDPIIYRMEQAIKDSGASYREIEQASGVTSQTLHAWFYGKTKRPQFATLNAVARAIGLELDIVRRAKGG
jgi:transcriptional regulator with XRE-family HTH domain